MGVGGQEKQENLLILLKSDFTQLLKLLTAILNAMDV